MMPDQAIQFTATQRNGGAFRQRCFVAHINYRTRITATDIKKQTSSALYRFILQRWVHPALVAVRRIGMQTVAASATGDRQRIKVRTLQQHILRFAVHAGMFAAKNTGYPQRLMVIGDHQRVRI